MIEELIDTADTGKIIREGLNVVITGKPNVGKSSLMNALLKENRAIVTEIPGTTRDTIEEFVSIKSIPVKLTDTAGIHQTNDKIEQIGIQKSKASFNEADLVIFVLDSSERLSGEDREIIEHIGDRRTIVLINKIDLKQVLVAEDISTLLPNAAIIETSMVDGTGIAAIEDIILDSVYGGKIRKKEDILITNLRHKELLEKGSEALKEALSMIQTNEALDFIEVDLKRAYEYLGEIVGETVSDDIIDQVFSRFCLGK